MPCTPIADSASLTSSSLKGLMMAVTSFMVAPGESVNRGLEGRSEALADGEHQARLAEILGPSARLREGEVLVGTDHGGAPRESGPVVGETEAVVGVVGVRVVPEPLVADVPDQVQAVAQGIGDGEVDVAGTA